MKTKTWIALLTVAAAVCLGLSLWLLWPKGEAQTVKVISQGEVKYILPLNEDTRIQITTELGTNEVTVKGGKVAVTHADCPDGYCVARGWCSGGTQIVCLPNRLVLEFSGGGIDAVSG